MNPIEVFGRYATAFEEAFQTDDWSVLEPFFTDDAVYETIGSEAYAGLREGRQAVLEYLRQSVDGFDRRFDVRERPEIVEGPRVDDDAVWIRWRVTYKVAGAPDLMLEGEETAVIDGGRIRRLEDRFHAETESRLEGWMAAHGGKLKPPAA